MSDEAARILSELNLSASGGAVASPAIEAMLDEISFDEAGYFRLNPDVAASVANGEFASGYHHYLLHGFREGRPLPSTPGEPRNRVIHLPPAPAAAHRTDKALHVEAVMVSPDGGLLIIGWLDDTMSPLQMVRLACPEWRISLDSSTLVRLRRGDVEAALGKRITHRFGFLCFAFVDDSLPVSETCLVQAWLENGEHMQVQVPCRTITGIELRNVLLTQLAQADFHGNPGVERIACLDGGLGDQIIAFNRAITRRLVASPYVERFGPQRRPRGTIVVALYGKSEFLPTQNALYSGRPGIEDYEFVYVSNSPELGETLMREARIGSLVYGIQQTVVVLSGNAGFGAANNVALTVAQSDRLLNVNPDVFPRDPDWAAKHTALVEAGGEGTRLFGVPLYYDDGSLMHGGMHFEADDVISIVDGAMRRRCILRVEHYGKGAPPEGTAFLHPRPVPAVTGAFISSERDWFERLGGFTEDFVFGHYEDADLCLKSLQAGVPSWLKDIRMWHFEGKGSTRLPPHEGGSVVNRWLFSRRWNDVVSADLLGPAPANPAFPALRLGTTKR